MIGVATALVKIDALFDDDDEGASLDAGSLDALRAAAAGAGAAVVRGDEDAVTGRAVAAADERTEEEEEASMVFI